MAKKEKKVIADACCSPIYKDMSCCKVESLISVDERGQMVLPKELREKAGIKSGDKFAVVSWEKEGKVCCLSLVKTEDFIGMVKGALGPMFTEMMGK